MFGKDAALLNEEIFGVRAEIVTAGRVDRAIAAMEAACQPVIQAGSGRRVAGTLPANPLFFLERRERANHQTMCLSGVGGLYHVHETWFFSTSARFLVVGLRLNDR